MASAGPPVVWTCFQLNGKTVASADNRAPEEASDPIREIIAKGNSPVWGYYGSMWGGNPYKGLRLDVFQYTEDGAENTWTYACVYRNSPHFKKKDAQCLLEKIAMVTENLRDDKMILTTDGIAGVLESIMSHQVEETEFGLGSGDQSLEYSKLVFQSNKVLVEERKQRVVFKAKAEKLRMEQERLRTHGESIWLNKLVSVQKDDQNTSLETVLSEDDESSNQQSHGERRSCASPILSEEGDADTVVTLENDLSNELDNDQPELGVLTASNDEFHVEMLGDLRCSADARFEEPKSDEKSIDDSSSSEYCYPCYFFRNNRSPIIELN